MKSERTLAYLRLAMMLFVGFMAGRSMERHSEMGRLTNGLQWQIRDLDHRWQAVEAYIYNDGELAQRLKHLEKCMRVKSVDISAAYRRIESLERELGGDMPGYPMPAIEARAIGAERDKTKDERRREQLIRQINRDIVRTLPKGTAEVSEMWVKPKDDPILATVLDEYRAAGWDVVYEPSPFQRTLPHAYGKFLFTEPFVDEADIPRIEGGAAEMSTQYPRIIIDGEKLEYSAQAKTYCYAGTDQRALWMEAGGDEKTAPMRLLATPERKLDDIVEVFVGGAWKPKEGKKSQ